MSLVKTLIIGYGNTLRQDDGVGRYLAEQIAEEQWPECQVLSVHQLTPELAASIAEVEQVIFIDAVLQPPGSSTTVEVIPLTPKLTRIDYWSFD